VLSIISILETMIAQATSIVKAIPIEFWLITLPFEVNFAEHYFQL